MVFSEMQIYERTTTKDGVRTTFIIEESLNIDRMKSASRVHVNFFVRFAADPPSGKRFRKWS